MTTTRGLKQAKSMLAVPGARHPESGRCLLRPEGEAFSCRPPGGACMARGSEKSEKAAGCSPGQGKEGPVTVSGELEGCHVPGGEDLL